jgi:hypothetical protein
MQPPQTQWVSQKSVGQSDQSLLARRVALAETHNTTKRNAVGEQRNGKRVSGVSCVLHGEVAVGMLGSHEAVDPKEGGYVVRVTAGSPSGTVRGDVV